MLTFGKGPHTPDWLPPRPNGDPSPFRKVQFKYEGGTSSKLDKRVKRSPQEKGKLFKEKPRRGKAQPTQGQLPE